MKTNTSDLAFTSIRYYKADTKSTPEKVVQIVKELRNQEGITDIRFTNEGISVAFLGHLISDTFITELLRKAGFPFAKEKKRKNSLNRFLEKLGKINRETYGDQRLDCCGLNHAKS